MGGAPWEAKRGGYYAPYIKLFWNQLSSSYDLGFGLRFANPEPMVTHSSPILHKESEVSG